MEIYRLIPSQWSTSAPPSSAVYQWLIRLTHQITAVIKPLWSIQLIMVPKQSFLSRMYWNTVFISTHLIRKDNESLVKPQAIFFLLKRRGKCRRQHKYLAINQSFTLQIARRLNFFSPSCSGEWNWVKITFSLRVLLGFFFPATLRWNSHHLHIITFMRFLHKLPPHPQPSKFKVWFYSSSLFIELWSPTSAKRLLWPPCAHMLWTLP